MTTPHGRVHLSQIIVAIIVDHGNRDVGGTWRLGPIIWSYLGPNDNYKPTCATLIACDRQLIEILGAALILFLPSRKIASSKNCPYFFIQHYGFWKGIIIAFTGFPGNNWTFHEHGWESWNFWYVDSNNNLMAIDIKIPPHKYNTNTIKC